MKAQTFCDFGQVWCEDRVGKHKNLQTARRQFKRIASIYYGIHGWRVWTIASSGQVICDTSK